MGLIILVIALIILNKNTILAGIDVNFITALVGYIIGVVTENFDDIVLMLVCYFKYKKEDIRVSISYLYRIKVDGKYLLVKSNRILEQYQPVGGVYKKYEGANKYLDKLGIKDDNGFRIDADNKDDLRLRVPSKNLNKFIKWFENREDRELDPIREFHEELNNKNILPNNVFQYFRYRFIRQKKNSIKYSEHFKCNEILISNIYELLPNEEQLTELKKLSYKENIYYKWFTCDEIECLGHTSSNEYRISPTAKWIL
jgi:DNA-directed RNA polymerase delta subunit